MEHTLPRALTYLLIHILTSRRWICSAFVQGFQRREASTPSPLPCSSTKTCLPALSPEPENSRFGRRDYWNEFYEKEQNFSWYAGWDELAPFLQDFISDRDAAVLLPGVGNDATLVDMYTKGGYRNLTAMDYAPEAIERCREMLEATTTYDVDLVVADARNLRGVFENEQFTAVFEKGTLDAIFLSGGQDKDLARKNMNLAIAELSRCVKPGGIFLSIAGVVTDAIQESFDQQLDQWECLVDKNVLYTSDEGYTSNNIDGNLLVWRKR
jgi:SAM-dependent methyltransferase